MSFYCVIMHYLLKAITPVDGNKLGDLLKLAGYELKTKIFFKGFTQGFSLEYEGSLTNVRRNAPNLKLRVGSPVELWNKVMKEVELGRFAGPFKVPPFRSYVQSPIGLVPKDKGLKTRLIFHLSYPKKMSQLTQVSPKTNVGSRVKKSMGWKGGGLGIVGDLRVGI